MRMCVLCCIGWSRLVLWCIVNVLIDCAVLFCFCCVVLIHSNFL